MKNTPFSLSLEGVSVEYGNPGSSVFGAQAVSLSVRPREIVGLVGESGSGKTTVMKSIVGLVRYRGRIEIDGTNPLDLPSIEASRRWLASKVGVVFQNAGGSLVPRMSVLQQVTLPMKIHRLGTASEQSRKAGDLLDLVRIPKSVWVRPIEQISGGQRQRVAIARSLALDPSLIIADEPTSALDISVRAQLITLLDELRRATGVSVLLISHDLTTIEYIADTIAVMYRGSIVELAATNHFATRRAHPYSRDLWAASPRLADPGGALRAPPRSSERSDTGCRYAPRCDRWTMECSVSLPELRQDEVTHVRCLHPISLPGEGKSAELSR